MQYNPRDEDSIKAVMAKANVVINLIGMHFLLQYFVSEALVTQSAQMKSCSTVYIFRQEGNMKQGTTVLRM